MPPTAHDPDTLLIQLEAAKNRFDPGHASDINQLLSKLFKLPLTDPRQLIRFHEALLFLRAFPHAPSHVARIENLLNTFHRRIETLRAANADMSLFDDFDTSGIAGTAMQDVLSFDVAQWLVPRIPQNVEIAWDDYFDDYQSERARGSTWPRFIPLLEEDADVEANIPWTRWLDAARGREKPLSWLIRRFQQLLLPDRQRAELYDSLRLPIRWRLENLKLTRTRNWTRPRRLYFHDGPLIQRSEVSLARELAQTAPRLEKLSLAAGASVMNAIREIMVVRYRELYGTTLGDPRTVVRADLGRGVIMHLWGLPPTRRLPLRAYVAGYTLKNGVPINYIEAIGLCEWIEVGFNTFYTYRQGETAWVYAQALRCLCTLTAAKCISIYPYQIGQNNDEALDSGAFWFYRKLGFRPGRPDLQALCEREEEKIAANPKYRTPRRILKRLAEAHMFYDLHPSVGRDSKADSTMKADATVTAVAGVKADATVEERPFQGRVTSLLEETGFSPRVAFGKGTTSSRAVNAPKSKPAPAGLWDTFSVRNLGLLINRRMSGEFDGDSRKIIRSTISRITRVLKINSARWTADQKHSLANWSLVLDLIPDLSRWSSDEKHRLIKIIRAKSSPNEMLYLRQTQHHPRLREALIRVGSKPIR